MARVRLFHWKAAEAGPLLKALRSAGHQVDYAEQWGSDISREIAAAPPDVFVFDLSRLPSHGRYLAIHLHGRKATRHIPLVFLGGDPDKAGTIRRELPDAVYADIALARSAIRSALARPPVNPATPTPMMRSYGARSTAAKLGIHENGEVGVIDPPRDYRAAIGEIPSGVVFVEEDAERCPLVLWFFHDAEAYREALPRLRRMTADKKVWILWRKSANGRTGVTLPFLRAAAAEFGLIDYKVCSVNRAWSGILVARRRARKDSERTE
jgi:hypothetical protein